MAMMMIKDNFQEFFEISGRNCFMNANFINGRVVGHICLSTSTKKMEFDFMPLTALRTKQIIFLELKRLFLDYQRDKNGDFHIVLDVLPEEEYLPKNDFNLLDTRLSYLGRIDGSPVKYLRINLRKLKKVTTEQEKNEIKQYMDRTGFPPPINFDTVRMEVILPTLDNDEDLLTFEFSLDRFMYLKKSPRDPFDVVPLS